MQVTLIRTMVIPSGVNQFLTHSKRYAVNKWEWSYRRATPEFIQMNACITVCLCVCVCMCASNFNTSIQVIKLITCDTDPNWSYHNRVYIWCCEELHIDTTVVSFSPSFFPFIVKMKVSNKGWTKLFTMGLNGTK